MSSNTLHVFLVQRTDSGDYDTYDGFVVCCETKEEAISYHPSGVQMIDRGPINPLRDDWTTTDHLNVTLLGKASNQITDGVILASYNSG